MTPDRRGQFGARALLSYPRRTVRFMPSPVIEGLPAVGFPTRRDVVGAAVRAADLWATRTSWPDADRSFRDLARMAGVVSLARACHLEEAPPPFSDLLDAFEGPVSELLPGPL